METRNQPIHFSIAPLMARVLITLFLIETGYVLVLVLDLALRPPIDAATLVVGLWILHTLKFAVMAWMVAKIVATWAGHGAYIGEDKLSLHSGLVNAEDTVFELDQLRSVSLHQGWLGRRLNYGELELKFGRLGNSFDVNLMDVHDPERYANLLTRCIGPEPRALPSPA